MTKLKSTLPDTLFSLTDVYLVVGTVLAGMNQFTVGPIAVAKAVALEEAIKAVAPEFDNKPTEDVYTAVSLDGDSPKIYPAKEGGRVVDGVVENSMKKGFSGEIRTIAGFDMDGKTLNHSVLQHAEAPDLGAKMQEWFRADKNKQSVLGHAIPDGGLKVTKDGGNADAITAVTISSRTFLDAMNRTYSVFAGVDGLMVPLQLMTNKKGGQNNE